MSEEVLAVCLVAVVVAAVVVEVVCMAGHFGVVPAGTRGGTTAVVATGCKTV